MGCALQQNLLGRRRLCEGILMNESGTQGVVGLRSPQLFICFGVCLPFFLSFFIFFSERVAKCEFKTTMLLLAALTSFR